MTKKRDHEYLNAALKILTTQGGATTFAENKAGEPVSANARDAVKFNMSGAIRRACGEHRAAERRIFRRFRAFAGGKICAGTVAVQYEVRQLTAFAKKVRIEGGA